MNNKSKIYILMGRGVEGCGVTRSVNEFRNYYKNMKVIATSDRDWARAGNDDYGFSEFSAMTWEECQKVVDEVNSNADYIIIYSVPSVKHPVECQDNFVKLVKAINVKKGMVHCDHSYKALHDNANLEEILKNVDLVMHHSETGVLKKFMDKVGIKTPFTTMGVGFNYDLSRAKYWKPIEQQDSKRIRWIGRTAIWKGPNLLIDFHEKELRSRDYITVLEGLEASMQSVLILFEDGFTKKVKKDVIQRFRGKKVEREFTYGEETPGNPAYLYPPYINAECMERLSLGAFGSDLYFLAAEKYGNNIENCHAEPVAVGTVPIFHKHFGDNVIHRVTGDSCTASTTSGTIWLDSSNYVETRELIEKLSKDLVMRDEWREMAFEFWKQHSDTQVIYDELVDKVKNFKQEVQVSGLDTFFG